MPKYHSNAHFHLFSFVRHRFWPLLIPSIAIIFLTFCPQLTQSIEIHEVHEKDYHQNNENSDRTVAKLGPRDLQLTTAPSPSPQLVSVPPTSSSTAPIDDFIHTLYVITLDGKITAIDAHANGRQLWTADTGSPLIDSSLSKIEISRDSQSVRLIPSLIGGLYEKYDEDGRVEPLPFDADDLLDASFKLHDELVITGGKHIDTLGLDLHTGQVLYSFSTADPKQTNHWDNNRTTTADNSDSRSTLVVKRTTQTVRARSARNGFEKWNFSVSNNELLHLFSQQASIVLGQVDQHTKYEKTFAGYFEYQLQTGVVLGIDKTGRRVWSSVVNSPIAAVWELKNGQLNEKSLFETTVPIANDLPRDDPKDDDQFSSAPVSRRLAFIGEFNSTPYVIVSPRTQRALIKDARKNNFPGLIGNKRPVLLSWQKPSQKITISIGSKSSKDHYQRGIGLSSSPHNFPLALRPDRTGNHESNSASSSSVPATDETCNKAGYLQLLTNSNDNLIEDDDKKMLYSYLNESANRYVSWIALVGSTLILAVMLASLIWCLIQGRFIYKRQESMMTETSISTTSTPEFHQLDPSLTPPPFQPRYTLEYEHVRFLGRGGFGVVFEAINKLDQRRVAIKRVSLKKASGKERALKEIRYLAVLNHPNLIQYYYAWNESPPVGWQEEEDKNLLVRNNVNARDTMSSFPTSANDSESNAQAKSTQASSISANKPQIISHSPSIEITFDRSPNPLRITEDFSANSNNNNESEEISSSSSSIHNKSHNRLDANNNNKSSKRSLSSSSQLFDHSSDSSLDSFELHEKTPSHKEITESDDGIVFLHDDQPPPQSPVPLIQTETKSLVEKKKLITTEKDIPIYFYFVMELCRPESLRDRLTQKTIDRHQAWSIFDQIVNGIEYIHSQKLIHRDLKPSNILFSMDNTVKIGDFGLVSAFGEDKIAKKKKRGDENIDPRHRSDTMSMTTDGCGNNEIGGTALYMSPEQINRQPYNQKVDIYAMGIILFELLYPFSTQMERMQAIANVRLPIPVFPNDFQAEGNNRNQLICRLIRWLLSHSSHDRPRAGELRHDTFYQRMLQLEVPHLFGPDSRQQNQTMVNGQDSTGVSQQQAQFGRNSSSTFRRTVSSSALHSHRESESGDTESLS